eukprot:4846365-Amphidinium_carterae.1
MSLRRFQQISDLETHFSLSTNSSMHLSTGKRDFQIGQICIAHPCFNEKMALARHAGPSHPVSGHEKWASTAGAALLHMMVT